MLSATWLGTVVDDSDDPNDGRATGSRLSGIRPKAADFNRETDYTNNVTPRPPQDDT